MGTEDKSGVQDPAPNNKSGDEASSLAARRARLRGTLAKNVTPPDPYVPDPYLTAKSNSTSSRSAAQTDPADAKADQGDQSSSGNERRRHNNASATGEMPALTSNGDKGNNGGNGTAPHTVPNGQEPSTEPAPELWEDPEPVKQGDYNHQPLVHGDYPASGSSPFVSTDEIEPSSPFSSHAPDSSPSPFRNLTEPAARSSPFVSGQDANQAMSLFASPQPEPATSSTPFLSGQTETPPSPFRKLHEDVIPTAAPESEPTQAGSFLESLAKKTFPLDPERTMSMPKFGAMPASPAAAPPPPPETPEEAPAAFMPQQMQNDPTPAVTPVTHRDATTPAAMPGTELDATMMPAAMPVLQPDPTTADDSDPAAAQTDESAAPNAVAPANQHPQENASSNMARTTGKDENRQPPAPAPMAPLAAVDPQLQAQALEVLNNIDQGMGACAMNLSALQKIAGEQTDTMRLLAETMQNQNFFEIGLNLNSLMESLSAALEPMKAVGELVPAIDQLVSTLESKEQHSQPSEPKLTAEQLVTSLADQLSNGTIDPWTFKSAYVAVYPSEHPADLLRLLVDLLGAKRLSGDLFRAAYDAVQLAEAPKDSAGGETRTIVKIVQDETLLAQLEELKKSQEELRQSNEELRQHNEELERGSHELRRANLEMDARAGEQNFDTGKFEEMHKVVDELQKRLDQRETEFADVMAAKDQELQEAQELLNSRWEEFNARYDELTETLHKRDELIAEKEAEVSRKEAENLQLKTQMEELRDSTKDMVAEMQKQLTAAASKPKEEQKQSSFFDPAPGAQQQQQPQPGALFDAGPSRPLFQPNSPQNTDQSQSQQTPSQQMQSQPMQPQQMQSQSGQQMPPQPAQQMQPAPQAPPQPNNSSQAIPRPAPTTAPFLTSGSYGSGVRAQVFEVIVRQALAGAPWREICAGPMSVNNITPEEVETEVKRRQALLGKK